MTAVDTSAAEKRGDKEEKRGKERRGGEEERGDERRGKERRRKGKGVDYNPAIITRPSLALVTIPWGVTLFSPLSLHLSFHPTLLSFPSLALISNFFPLSAEPSPLPLLSLALLPYRGEGTRLGTHRHRETQRNTQRQKDTDTQPLKQQEGQTCLDHTYIYTAI